MMGRVSVIAAAGCLITCYGLQAAEPGQNAPPEEPPAAASPASDDVRQEIEQLRSQLGPDYSIDSKVLDIPFTAPRLDQPADNAPAGGWKFNPQATPEGPKPEPMDELTTLIHQIRQQARAMEAMASAFEDDSSYHRADQLREAAWHQWQVARRLAAIATGNPREGKSRELPPPYSPPFVPPGENQNFWGLPAPPESPQLDNRPNLRGR